MLLSAENESAAQINNNPGKYGVSGRTVVGRELGAAASDEKPPVVPQRPLRLCVCTLSSSWKVPPLNIQGPGEEKRESGAGLEDGGVSAPPLFNATPPPPPPPLHRSSAIERRLQIRRNICSRRQTHAAGERRVICLSGHGGGFWEN